MPVLSLAQPNLPGGRFQVGEAEMVRGPSLSRKEYEGVGSLL